MNAADMPRGSSIWGYKIVRRKCGSSSKATWGGQSFAYYDGGFVADDEEVIDCPTATKMHDYSGGFGSPGEDVWWQEPGGQAITDEQVDELVAAGAQVRLGS